MSQYIDRTETTVDCHFKNNSNESIFPLNGSFAQSLNKLLFVRNY